MFAVVYIPQFSLQAALRHQPELWSKPVAIVDPTVRTPVIGDMTEAARCAGIIPGLTATQAMARCPEVIIRPSSARQEDAATAALLQCAYAFSPHLENTASGLCTLDLQSISAVKDLDETGLTIWAGKLQAATARAQLSAAIGLGPTPNVARHAARWGGGIEIVQAAEGFIIQLPVTALEPSAPVAHLLKRWGIRTVGELLALGQEALTARLGLEALALLAAASCTAVRPLHWAAPTERFEESFEFDPSVETVEPVLFILRRFIDQISQRLELRGFVAEILVLQFGLDSGEKLSSRVRLPHPTRQPDVLFRTLHTALENVRTESPVRAVELRVLPTPEEQKQLGLFETILSNPQQFQETLARLAAVLGPDRVGTPALEDSHRPDAFRLVPPDFENAPVPQKRGSSLTQTKAIRRFRPAIKAEVFADAAGTTALSTAESGHAPVAIRCAIAQGRLKVMVGPWRASGQWWESSSWERVEWDAATSDGQVLRLVHQADGWFVEGVID